MPSHKKPATHPNSRRVLQIAKEKRKAFNRIKASKTIINKESLLHSKLLFFKDLLDICEELNARIVECMIKKYLNRFEEELDDIKKANSIGCPKTKYIKREQIIRMTMERESAEFYGGGIEVPDLLNPNQLKILKEWNGDPAYLSLFKLKRYSQRYLDSVQGDTNK